MTASFFSGGRISMEKYTFVKLENNSMEESFRKFCKQKLLSSCKYIELLCQNLDLQYQTS